MPTSILKKPLSIGTTLSIVIVSMGVLAISLALMAGGIYRDLAFDNQREALADLVDLKTDDITNDLIETSAHLGTQLAAEPRFTKAFKEKNAKAVQREINEQFFQYYVTANIVRLKKLYVFDLDYNLITESSAGDTFIPAGQHVCPQLIEEAAQRQGAARLKKISRLCLYNGRPVFSVITVIGGLFPKGYIEVVTDPTYNLRDMEGELGMPIKIKLANNETVFQSKHWPDESSMNQMLIADDAIETPNAELAMTIEVSSPIKSLLEKLSSTRLYIILITGVVTWLSIMLVMLILRHMTLNPLRRLTTQVRLVSHDKSHLGEEVSVEGNTEVRELASDFNYMTGELKQLYATLENMAFTDSLTSLPNRAMFQDRIQHLTELSRREGRKFCVIMMDLDRFKEVNDTLGHEFGDKLLQLVSERLTGSLRKSDTVTLNRSDTVARLGGDEFAALLPTTQHTDGALVVARKICDLMSQPFQVDHHIFNIGISIGISMFPRDGGDATTLMRHADIAMYNAKKAQKGFSFYDPELDQHSVENLTLGNELRETIANNKLDLHFQPKVDLTSGRICGAEALVRWTHPDKGFIPPDRFVVLAERIGLIHPLTLWVLNRSLEQISQWHGQGLPIDIAVNLSPQTLHNASMLDDIQYALKDYRVPPSALWLELTETAVMSDPQQALEILTDLDRMGVKLSVDDFGTGYSSLSHLRRLPVDEIKIDRSFVMDMLNNQNDEAIVRSTIDLAHNMNLKVIAEGIEDQHTYALLQKLGCDMGQGYYMGRPVGSADFDQWLNTSPWGMKPNK